jgi:hypothetical protein
VLPTMFAIIAFAFWLRQSNTRPPTGSNLPILNPGYARKRPWPTTHDLVEVDGL